MTITILEFSDGWLLAYVNNELAGKVQSDDDIEKLMLNLEEVTTTLSSVGVEVVKGWSNFCIQILLIYFFHLLKFFA